MRRETLNSCTDPITKRIEGPRSENYLYGSCMTLNCFNDFPFRSAQSDQY